MFEPQYQPSVNSSVLPTLVFGKDASNFKRFPETRPQDGSDGYTNFDDGIPADYSANVQSQLKARIEDVNAIGRLASDFTHYRQCGGIVTYDKEVASLIGGYPKDAVLEYWDGEKFRRVVSLIEDNDYDFVENPGYIDGIHWVFADVWGRPYGIFVDPSRTATLDVLSAGTANPALGWETDESEYNRVYEDVTWWYRGKLSLMKSKWIQICNDSFVAMSVTVGDVSHLPGYPNLYWVVAGYRVKTFSGEIKTFPMTVTKDKPNWSPDDAVFSEVNGTVFPLIGNGHFSKTESGDFIPNAVDVGYTPGSTCLYMGKGSMLQMVYAPPAQECCTVKIHVVRLKGR